MKEKLPNIDRAAFFKTVTQLLSKSDLAKQSLGLMLVDIRDFKRINRTFGFACGDKILADVFHRLYKVSRFPNVVARVGNDQFTFLLPGLRDSSYIALAANKIIKELNKPFTWYDKEINLTIRVGGAGGTDSELSCEALLAMAESSIQQAKDKDLPFVLDESQQVYGNLLDWKMEKELLEALHRNELDLHFQPKISLQTALPLHAEALLRWHSKEHGNVPPDRIIPIIERAGKMLDITKWVLNASLRRLKEWPTKFGTMGVAVNIPANIVHERELCEVITTALGIWGVDPCLLTLEITESAVIKDTQSSHHNLAHLKETGIKISIDDFGTGYSSLEYFKHIPADELKVDRSFVFNMSADVADKNIVKLIIDLAHIFKLHVVAEGIEDAETLHMLRELGCDYAQGYYISRPMEQTKFIEWINNYDPKPFAKAWK